MPGIGPQQAEGHRVIDLGVLDQVPFQLGDLLVVGVDQGQVGARSSAACSGRRSGRQIRRCGWRRRSASWQRRQVELAVGVDDVGDELRRAGGRRSCGGAAGRGSARLALG